MASMVKKHQIALFLDVEPFTTGEHTASFKRIKKSTELTISLNPETVDYEYIADENPTTELDKYKPSISQPLTMYSGEEDFSFIWDKFYNLSSGSEAKTTCMLVYIFDSTDVVTGEAPNEVTTSYYKAWEVDCVLSINDLNAIDSTINFDILFGGDITNETVVIADGVPTVTPIPE